MIPAQGENHGLDTFDPQTSLQANKATFFFRVVSSLTTSSWHRTYICHIQERELEKVNKFYLQKEAEVLLSYTITVSLAYAVPATPSFEHTSRQEESNAAASTIGLQVVIQICRP